MSRNGSGTYSLPAGNPVVTGTTITTTWANTTLNDIASALTGSVAADGQTPMSSSLNMANNKIISLATPTSSTDAVTKAYADALISGYGTMATQNANNVNITGGSITGVAGSFTTLAASSDVNFTGTGYVLIPAGTVAQRPASPVVGEIRYNTDYNSFEGYSNGTWGQLGGGATGGGGDQVFVENGVTVTANYTLSTNKNAESVGPITINASKTVTVPSGQRWVIL
jgi:hypothetical protein